MRATQAGTPLARGTEPAGPWTPVRAPPARPPDGPAPTGAARAPAQLLGSATTGHRATRRARGCAMKPAGPASSPDLAALLPLPRRGARGAAATAAVGHDDLVGLRDLDRAPHTCCLCSDSPLAPPDGGDGACWNLGIPARPTLPMFSRVLGFGAMVTDGRAPLLGPCTGCRECPGPGMSDVPRKVPRTFEPAEILEPRESAWKTAQAGPTLPGEPREEPV